MSSTRITAAEVPADLTDVDLLIDVRSAKGRAENGELASAVILPKAQVEPIFSGPLAPVSKDARIVVFCGSVAGSGPVVEVLQRLGYRNAVDVEGGYAALKERGLA
ncbi:rhodanese-like domain-containing protein [Paenirhodobacter sp.]|uniref:rhodanese-like domain-containing protein n=1 Tax=Paenirhodobacter sp. TaxID=1965326 RepID=UPI003B40FC20